MHDNEIKRQLRMVGVVAISNKMVADAKMIYQQNLGAGTSNGAKLEALRAVRTWAKELP